MPEPKDIGREGERKGRKEVQQDIEAVAMLQQKLGWRASEYAL